MININVSVKTIIKVGIIVACIGVVLFGLWLHITNKVTSTNTGFEDNILNQWNDSMGYEYIIDDDCKVVVTELEYVHDDNETTQVRAHYIIYDNYGKQIGSGYNPTLILE